MELDVGAGFRLRPAAPADMPAFRRVCLLTGDAGDDASHLHDDPDLVGDFFAVPYAVLEPEHAFAVEGRAGVAGYVLGALDSRAFYQRMAREWLPRLRARAADPGPDETRWRGSDWVRRLVHHPPFALPPVLAPFPAHGHIDLLPEAQGRGVGRGAFAFLMHRLAAAGSPGMHLQVHPQNHRAQRFYRALGFVSLVSDELPVDTHFMGRRLP
jgi:ribosomal protein S18 acetylase RimI-like enzyme